MKIKKAISKLCQALHFEPTPGVKLPHSSDYLALYPERLVHGKITCNCKSTKLKAFCTRVNADPIFYKCQDCGEVLFTADLSFRLDQGFEMKHLKLAVFDMEGTIFRNSYRGQEYPSIWKVLCQACGPEAVKEDADNTQKYLSGGYSDCYSAWVLDTLHILKKYGLKKDQFEAVINEIDYYPGVEETFMKLRDQGVVIAVISGGLKALADRVAIDHYVDHCFSAAEFYWNPDGTIRHWNLHPTDFEHKRSLLEILCRDLGISKEECLFVGDGRNDCSVAGFCALSIGFNPHVELRKVVDVAIKQTKGRENLAAILKPITQSPKFTLNNFSENKAFKSSELVEAVFSTISASAQRSTFHAFLMRSGLTFNSANSYCSYLNNLCKNIAEISWNGATRIDAFSVLERIPRSVQSEEAFIDILVQPLSGRNGRQNDTTSAAKQYYRFVNGGTNVN